MSIANVLLVDDEVSIVKTFSERWVVRILNISKAFGGEDVIQILEANHTVHGNSFDRVGKTVFSKLISLQPLKKAPFPNPLICCFYP